MSASSAVPPLVVVHTAVETSEQAETLAVALVEARLAACVQVLPIRSIYRWKGKLERAAEHLVLAKTRADLAELAVAFIRERHPYELPEIVTSPVLAALPAYARWVAAETERP